MKTYNKYIGILAAACMMAGCQNEGNIAPEGQTFKMRANAAVPETKTAIIPEGEDQYKPLWKAGDMIGVVEKALQSKIYSSYALEVDAESATFTAMMTEIEADSYTYCTVYPYEAFKTTTDINALVCNVPAEQSPAVMTSFDGNADILVSELVERTSQPVEDALAFTMRRLTAVGNVTFKGFSLLPGEMVNGWSMTVDGAIAGTVTVDPAAEELAFTAVQTTGTIKVNLPETKTEAFTSCFACLPYTLESGDEYTMTIHTNLRNINKTSQVNTPLVFAASRVMNFTVNMANASVSVAPESFSADYDYVITSTLGTETYILSNASTNSNPALFTLSGAGLQLAADGTIVGEVASQYRWQATSNTNNGVITAKFEYTNAKGAVLHLIHCDKAQGLAVKVQNEDGSYTAQYAEVYSDVFSITNVDGGYSLNGSGRVWGADANYLRWGAGSAGVIRFHRVNKATFTEEPVGIITKAEDVVPGKYLFVGYNDAKGVYSLISGAAVKENPSFVSAADMGVNIVDDVLCAALPELNDIYIWELAEAPTEGYWIISNVSTTYKIYSADKAQGVSVQLLNDLKTDEWKFVDNNGLQAQISGSARYLTPWFVDDELGIQWRMSGLAGHLLLISVNE